MKILWSVVLGIVSAVVLPVSLYAKGATTRITIAGDNLATPVQITEPAVARKFNVWSGPGVEINGANQLDGFIADWRAGAVAPPTGLRHYDVSFYTTGHSANGDEELAYVVSYDCDASGREGYVYLPGGRVNVRSIYRGPEYEKHWFRATEAWRLAAQSAIASASR